ncbi:MAG: SDR family oxidoreductase [Deltaproteobacteria bacterium]|nr:SDR family oxidoreductase [Deltaproteobacteria bacterium]
MRDKTVLVTGSTDGIGKQTSHELARLGARVLVHGRTQERCDAACREIAEFTGNREVEPVVADFTSLEAVRRMIEEVARRVARLDVLINNAGAFMKQRRLTGDRLETTFAVNHCAHFVLTNGLLGLLRESAPARVVTVSSIAHQRGRIEWDNLQGERHFDGYEAYANSKLCNALFTYELAERLTAARVTSNCLHPGIVATKLLGDGVDSDCADPQAGCATSVFLASSPEVEGVTGRYFVDCREATSSPSSLDVALRQELWRVTERLVNRERGA